MDFLYPERPEHREQVGPGLDRARFLAVPSFTPRHSAGEFANRAWEEARRYGRRCCGPTSPRRGGARSSSTRGAWSNAYHTRIEPGLVHDCDIQSLRNADWTDQPVRIAVVHHPLTQNSGSATEVAPYSGLTNAGQLQAALQEQQFMLLLHGHTHAAYLEKKDNLLVAGAAALGSRELCERHGFNEITVLREGGSFTCDSPDLRTSSRKLCNREE